MQERPILELQKKVVQDLETFLHFLSIFKSDYSCESVTVRYKHKKFDKSGFAKFAAPQLGLNDGFNYMMIEIAEKELALQQEILYKLQGPSK